MIERLYKLLFKIAYKGYAAGEGAAFDLPTATRLIGEGVCVVDPSEPEREALTRAVAAYVPPKRDELWMAPLVSDRKGGLGRPWKPGASRFGPVKP